MKNTNTPLMEAIKNRNYKEAKSLIINGADVNAENSKKETAFMMFDLSYISILSFGSDCGMKCQIDEVIDVMSVLIDKGASVNHKNQDGQTVFMKYVNHYFEITNFLIDKGAEINVADEKGNTPLIYAMDATGYLAQAVIGYNGNDKLYFIELLIANGAEVNIKTKEDMTPLMIASKMKGDKVVTLLIQKGANVNDKDNKGETALLKVLGSSGFGIPKNGDTDNNIINILIMLLKAAGAQIDVKDDQGNTPFFLAEKYNLSTPIKLLLKYGVDIHKENIDIYSLFLKSLWHNDNFELSNYLLNNGFDINSKDKDKNTPLLSSIQDKYNENIIEYLINKGANINLQNEFGYTPLMILIRDMKDEENNKIISYLIEECGDINTALSDTPLITAYTLAIINKKEAFSNILEKAGADTFNTLKYLLANDLYFEKKYFEDTLKALLPNDIEYNMRLYLLESWSYFDKRIDVDKIDKCIFLLEKLRITIGFNSNEFGESFGSHIFINSNGLNDVKQKLEANLHSIKAITFKDVLKMFIKFPEKLQALSDILKKFSNDERLRYSNHDWDVSEFKTTKKELNYANFKEALTEGWNDLKNNLKIYAPTLHDNIEFFLFKDVKENTPLFGATVDFGWSSSKVMEANLLGGSESNKPEHLEKFQEMINIFKKSFVIKEGENYGFLNIFLNIKENPDLQLTIDLNDLKKKRDFKIFTDVPSLKQAFISILKEINDRGVKENVKITLSEEKLNNKKTVALKIIHKDSTSKKSAEELANNIETNGGRFNIIYDNLRSICDWSIDTKCIDEKRYKIDYLYPEIDNNKPHITLLEDPLEGFTYILRFYI